MVSDTTTVREGRDVQPVPWLHILWQAFLVCLFLACFGHALFS